LVGVGVNAMKQFVAWARVSSARQKKEGFSLQDQEARLTEFAQRLGGQVVKLYKIAESASKREERDTFREFTAYVRKHARSLSGMLFVKVDRAARNMQDWAELEALAEQSHVPLFFPDQPSAETPAGRMQRRMSAVFASYQTDQQSSDIRSGMKRRIDAGFPLGRQYGFRNVRVNGRSIIEHDPINAPKVKRLFELFAYRPHTLESVADELARQGIIFNDKKPRFHRATLFRILRNRHYIGDVRFKGAWYPGQFEPLIDLATFQAVQERFQGKVYRRPELTFAGRLIRCGHCGHLVTGETKRKRLGDGSSADYSYYFCTHYQNGDHPRIRWTEPELDAQFLALFDRMRIDDASMRQWIMDVIRAKAHAGQEQNQLHRAELQRQRTVIEGKLKTLLELRIDGEVTAEEYSAKRTELHDRQAGIGLQLETTDHDDREVADLAVKAFELSQSLRARWVTADYAAKRTILEILCESVRSNSQKLEITLRKPFDLLSNGFAVSLSGGDETRTRDLFHAMEALYQN